MTAGRGRGAATAAALVLLAAVVPYLNSLQAGFHYDDEHALVRNPHLRSLASAPGYFVDSSTFSAEPAMAMYRPLLLTTFAVNHALSGYRPWSWHLVNVLVHAAAAAAVLVLGRRLLGPAGGLAAGLVFALHPVQSQTVDYLSSRSEGLAVCLVLWALVALHGRHPGRGLGLYAAGLLTKSAAVVLVPTGLLLAALRPPLHRLRWALVAALTVGYVLWIQLEGFLPRSLAQQVRPYGQQLWTQTKALAYYARLAALPRGLSVEHGVEVAASPWAPEVWLAGALAVSIAGLAGAAVWRRTGTEVAGLGALWFLAGLGLTFLVPLNVIVSEHRLYLPIAGLALVLGACVATWGPHLRRLGVLGLALMVVLVWQQNRLWDNPLDLWTVAVERAPRSARAWGNYGLALQDSGQRAAALEAYERAITLHPDHDRAWNNIGLLHEASGRATAALAAYRRAAAAAPGFSGPLANLARMHLDAGRLDSAAAAVAGALARNRLDPEALVHAGRLAQVRGDAAAARARYERAWRLHPGTAAAANNLGLLLWEAGDVQGARSWLRRAVDADPADVEAALNLAILDAEGRGVRREAGLRQLLADYPERSEPVLALARLLRRGSRWPALEGLLRDALARGIDDPEVRTQLGAVLLRTGDPQAALSVFRQACEQAPHDHGAWAGRAAAAGALGQLREALMAARRLVALAPADTTARANLARLEAAASRPSAGAVEGR